MPIEILHLHITLALGQKLVECYGHRKKYHGQCRWWHSRLPAVCLLQPHWTGSSSPKYLLLMLVIIASICVTIRARWLEEKTEVCLEDRYNSMKQLQSESKELPSYYCNNNNITIVLSYKLVTSNGFKVCHIMSTHSCSCDRCLYPLFSHIFFLSFYINKDESCSVPVSVGTSSHYVGNRFLLIFKDLVSAKRMSCLAFSLMFITSHHYCLTTVRPTNYKICHFSQYSFLICQCNISGYLHIVV